MIREGTIKDITGIIALGKEAADLSPVYHDLELDEQRVRRYLAMMVASRTHHVGVLEVNGTVEGALLGQVSTMLWMKGRQAGDDFFYVRPAHAGNARVLVRQFVDWAKPLPNVKMVGLSTSFGKDIEKTENFFESCGLSKIGSIFIQTGDESE